VSTPSPAAPASFRDRGGRLFRTDRGIVRGLTVAVFERAVQPHFEIAAFGRTESGTRVRYHLRQRR
jgi:hypothetical protein